jgi:protein O-mannosyl-transferase
VNRHKLRAARAPLAPPDQRRRERHTPELTHPASVWRRREILAGICLLAITLAAYAPVFRYGLVDYDDIAYITDNPSVRAGLTLGGAQWAFTTGYMANWHPLTWLSHMLDVQLFGDAAGGYHAINLFLHALNTLLLFGVFRSMTGSLERSAFVAALFAVHPMHVESVAWVAERKDVLSTLFWLLAMWAYSSYARAPRWSSYATVAACLALGLLSKPMVVTLPCVLLLLDVWPLRRPLRAGLLWEKLPLFALALASSVVTVIAQRRGGAMVRVDLVPLPVRATNAIVAYAQYIRKMLWPVDLAAMYPMSRGFPDPVALSAAVALLIAITALAVRERRRYPYVLVGWLWFLGTLVPVIGVVQVGVQSMADRYSYIPLVGLFLLVVWGVSDLSARVPVARVPLRVAAVVTVLFCVVLSLRQVRYWRSSELLWTRAMEVTPDNYFAQANLAYVLWRDGRSAEAIPLFRQSLRIRPDFAEVHNNLGVALADQGELGEARSHFREAVRVDPSYAVGRDNLAAIERRLRVLDSALAGVARDTLTIPRGVAARNELGAALAAQGRFADAAKQFREAIRIDPDQPDVHFNLGAMLQRQGRLDDAVVEYRTAIRLNPRHRAARDALAGLGAHLPSVP